MNTELKRKTVHIGMAVFALCIGRLAPWLITVLCGVAFMFNLLVLPKLTGKGLERKEDIQRGYAVGMLIYPAVLLVLSLIFFEAQVFVAIGWGAMAFGDGFAGLFGKAIGGPTFSWNPNKRWSGLISFILMGSLLTLALIFLLPEAARLGIPPGTWLWVLPLTMLFAGLVESIPGVIDDNLAVPMTAALLAFFLSGIDHAPPLPEHYLSGLVLVLLLTAASIASRKIDWPGGLVGGLLAWCLFLGLGLNGLMLLFAFFVLGAAASAWKVQEKKKLGLAQENRGKRSIRHAISNGGVAAACALFAWFYPGLTALAQAMAAASLASATADTLSSELGNVYGRRFVNILSLKKDQRGLDGVISLEGSLLGALGSATLALLFFAGGAPLATAVLVMAAGIFGNIVDSALGASLQRKGFMTNDTVNFANTLAAAVFLALIF